MRVAQIAVLSIGSLLALVACSAPELDAPGTIEAAVASTVEAMITEAPPTDTPSPTQTPVPTDTPNPTETDTPTPMPLTAAVSSATNCRSGPGPTYRLVMSLVPGQVAEVVAKNDDGDYWYVIDPANPGISCWLWGEYATVQGDTSKLPVFTPEPSPTPQVGFTVYHYGFFDCGDEFVVLTVINSGGTAFVSASTRVDDITASEKLHSRIDRHPFAAVPNDCPPDHSNLLPPGSSGFLVLPLGSYKGGNDAMATISLCTKDYAGGHCVTEVAYFRLPD